MRRGSGGAEAKRIGLMVPANNVVVEPEYYAVGAKGVTFHSDRLQVDSDARMGLWKMLRRVGDSAKALSGADPDVIAYCCLSSSFIGGLNWDKKLGEKISQLAGGIPTVTAASAGLEALRKLGVSRVATYSAYRPSVNRVMLKFLRDNGVAIASSKALGLDIREVGRQDAETTFEQVSRLPTREADGLFIGSTDLTAMSVVGRLEKETGLPVVSVNQAVLWAIFRLAGIWPGITGYGSLFRLR